MAYLQGKFYKLIPVIWTTNKYFVCFILAGADIIETASYQATLEGFKDFMSLKKEDAEKLIESSSDLAKTAVEKFRSLGMYP